MRCFACGEKMRVVEVVPDDTMLVHGYEYHTLECPGCHEVERRLQFTREVERVEPPPLPSEPDQDQPVTALSTVAIPAGVAAPSTAVAPGTSTVAASTVALSTWARAVDRLRSQQSYLQERQAQAKAAEAIGRFHEDWENLARSRRQSDAIVAPPVPAAPSISSISKVAKPFNGSKLFNGSKPSTVAKAFKGSRISMLSGKAVVNEARAQLRTAPSSAMARAIAGLHRQTAARQEVDRTSDDSKRFDELWESFAPRPSAPAPSSQPAAQSRSLVPVEEHEASSALGASDADVARMPIERSPA
jgi:hypothetical protein